MLNMDFSRLKRIVNIPNILILSGILMLLVLYYQIIFYEVRYYLFQNDDPAVVVSKIQFKNEPRIIIPKLKIDAPIILDVDPLNEKTYQIALSKGVALANTSAKLDENGRSFLFAHSSANFYEASRYNSIFYLVNKLEDGDIFYITYDGQLYEYKMTGREYVLRENTDLMYSKTDNPHKELFLMTCWPPGTTLKRLIIKSEMLSVKSL